MRPGFGPEAEMPCFISSVTASRRLQFATRFSERRWRQPPRRSGFGTRYWPHSFHNDVRRTENPFAWWRFL